MAQVKRVTVKGTVTDAVAKFPLPGATVSVAGKPITATGPDGRYTVTMGEGEKISFKSLGYAEQEFTLKPGQLTIDVQLKEGAGTQMKETVVRGYVRRTREQTAGASTIITAKEVQDNPVSNVEQLLQGKVAGLNIQNNTGAPGQRGSVNIRGLSTIATTGTGDATFLQPTSPLYVIDGVPLDADKAADQGFDQQGPGVSPLSLIPQEDIASMEILKDASATSLYGSRGAYGVILITTVRGRSKIPRILYTSNYVLRDVPKLRETLGGVSERSFKIGQIQQYGLGDDRYRITNTPFLTDSLNAFYNNSTNWQDIFYSTRFNMTHNLNLDGGDDRFNYKVNLKYLGENGIVENTGFDNYSMNMNMQYKPTTRLGFFGQVRTALGRNRSGSGTGVLQRIVGDSGNRSTLLPGPSFLLATSDVLSSLNIRETSGPKMIATNVNANYELIPNLNLSTQSSYDYTTETQDRFLPSAANAQFAQIYNFYGYTSVLYNRNNISYIKSLSKHNFFLNVFDEIYVRKQQQSSTRIERTPNDQFEGPLGYDGNLSRGGGVLQSFFDLKSASVAAAFTYDYDKKYIAEFTYRIDGNSSSGQENPFTRNPSLGLKWNINKEAFAENWKWLDYADLRLTGGQTIQPVGLLVDIYGRYVPTGFYNNQPRVGIDFGRIPNPLLKPKNQVQYNFDVDFGIKNGLIEVVYDTYYKNITSELFLTGLDNTLAFGSYQSNDAAFVNYGHELSITSRVIKSGKLTWTVQVNGALNYDVLTKLPAQFNGQFIELDDPGNPNLAGQFIAKRVGRNALSNYLYQNNGVYSTTADVPVDPVTGLRLRNASANNILSSYQGGDAKLLDANGDYVIDARDRQVGGNTQPLVTGGFSNTWIYGPFNLNIYSSYTAVRSILNNALADRMLLLSNPYGTNAVPPAGNLRVWNGPGDATAQYANVYNYAHESYMANFRKDQTLWQESGSYFKINQITLSYNFDKNLVKRLGLSNIRTYISGNNVAIFSPYSGPNPENVTQVGKDISSGYPIPRSYTLGFNVTF
ncbi:SusC/RagA family TonB-linked outer membrane protein [Mucilaginibacter myungsuensis]|nr:SusC/RagA family TonB-linked outer membrane protein [Mucilaginibacter myungsuensis]